MSRRRLSLCQREIWVQHWILWITPSSYSLINISWFLLLYITKQFVIYTLYSLVLYNRECCNVFKHMASYVMWIKHQISLPCYKIELNSPAIKKQCVYYENVRLNDIVKSQMYWNICISVSVIVFIIKESARGGKEMSFWNCAWF